MNRLHMVYTALPASGFLRGWTYDFYIFPITKEMDRRAWSTSKCITEFFNDYGATAESMKLRK
jgi:hypothetical protein